MPDISPPFLEIAALGVSRDGRSVLKNLDFRLCRGSAALLTGPNGCGKTTMLRTIAGFIKPDTGSVRLFSANITAREWKRKRHLLAYVPQEDQTQEFPVTVQEMVASGAAGLALDRGLRKIRLEKALEHGGCRDLRRRPYFSLSGGEKRRVALARCLCQDARLLLLDEPLIYLDRESRTRFLDVLDHIRLDLGISVLMVSHAEENLVGGNWLKYRMNDGRIEAFDV